MFFNTTFWSIVCLILFIHLIGEKIYVAPSKALVQEKLRDWNQKFGSWGINCLELTGDNDYYSTRNIQEADIILTTPEVSAYTDIHDMNK